MAYELVVPIRILKVSWWASWTADRRRLDVVNGTFMSRQAISKHETLPALGKGTDKIFLSLVPLFMLGQIPSFSEPRTTFSTDMIFNSKMNSVYMLLQIPLETEPKTAFFTLKLALMMIRWLVCRIRWSIIRISMGCCWDWVRGKRGLAIGLVWCRFIIV